MDRWSIPAGELEAAFTRAAVLHREIERKERALGRKVQTLAKGLADLMQPGEMHYRRSIGVHAFPVAGVNCLAAAYLDEERDGFEYHYAVLCGGEAAKWALKTADLDPGDSDEPGSRRVALADYDDYVAFVERLPAYLGDVTRDLEACLRQAENTETRRARSGASCRLVLAALAREPPGGPTEIDYFGGSAVARTRARRATAASSSTAPTSRLRSDFGLSSRTPRNTSGGEISGQSPSMKQSTGVIGGRGSTPAARRAFSTAATCQPILSARAEQSRRPTWSRSSGRRNQPWFADLDPALVVLRVDDEHAGWRDRRCGRCSPWCQGRVGRAGR